MHTSCNLSAASAGDWVGPPLSQSCNASVQAGCPCQLPPANPTLNRQQDAHFKARSKFKSAEMKLQQSKCTVMEVNSTDFAEVADCKIDGHAWLHHGSHANACAVSQGSSQLHLHHLQESACLAIGTHVLCVIMLTYTSSVPRRAGFTQPCLVQSGLCKALQHKN